MSVDYENDVVLVTCANGKQAAHLIPFLLPKWKHLRLAVKSESSRQELLKKHTSKPLKASVEVVQADLTQPDDCKRICEGVTSVFHIGPSFHPRETDIGYNIIDASNSAKVQHFIYSSVLHPNLRKLIHHDCKRYVEEYLIESSLPYTILQPSTFLDQFPIQKLLSEDRPIFPARRDPNVPFSYTSLHDNGEAGAKVLEEREKHFWATYQFISTSPPMSYHEICAIVGKKIGKEVKAETVPFAQTVGIEGGKSVEAMFGLQENEYSRDAAQRMLLYYNYRGLVGSTNVLRWVLGRETMGWEAWVEGTMGDGEGVSWGGEGKRNG